MTPDVTGVTGAAGVTGVTGWRAFGASVRGPSHEREGLPGQDAIAWSTGEHGTAVCLCDGAGSAARPEIGAAVVAAAVVDALRDLAVEAQGDPGALEGAVRAASGLGRDALLREARARGLAPEDLACTVVVIAASGGHVAVAHLGDGAVVGRRESGELFVLSAPDRGEFANETWFLSAPSWESRLRVALHEGVDAFCAFTDGCQDAALVRGHSTAPLAPFAPFCAPLFEFAGEVSDPGAAAAEVAGLLDAARLRRSSGDDKTLAVALRLHAPAAPAAPAAPLGAP